MTPVDAAREYCRQLQDAGVRAVHDPRKLVPPCIIISPPTVTIDMGCGGTAQWSAHAVAASNASDAWAQIDGMVAISLGVLPVENVTPVGFPGGDGSEYLAFQMTWSAPVAWDAA
jgi:hypothetical protein